MQKPTIRVAIIKKVLQRSIQFQFLNLEGLTFDAPIPHPYAGRGGGVLVGIEVGTKILVSSSPGGEKWYCVGIIPDSGFLTNASLENAFGIKTHETNYPTIRPGEIIVKSNAGSQVELRNTGNICLDAGAGLSIGDLELSRSAMALYTRVDNKYTFTESGRSVEGIIQRDLNSTERAADTDTLNFLDSERSNKLLKPIGRSNLNEVHNRTTNLIKSVIRNPALVEKREIIYEYANSSDVRHFENEIGLSVNLKDSSELDDSKDIIGDIAKLKLKTSDRANRRSDILNLNQRNFNHLIEKVEGTVVDIYGNVLDINRNIINIPDSTEIGPNADAIGLKRVYDHHRRAVKFHYEINSRKDIKASDPSVNDRITDNAKNFSRWSIDVDGEGLTKINIPASSETGNIPILSRYFTSRDPDVTKLDSGSFKDPERKDIRIKQFGAKDKEGKFSGVTIDKSDYAPTSIDGLDVTVGTAYHDLMSIADSIFSGENRGKLATESISDEAGLSIYSNGPISKTVNNKILDRGIELDADNSPNAGGRSLHMNLDGSMELSIGADTRDKKSLVIDTQGAVISHYGKDRNGRSIIHQTDGDIILQVGSDGYGVGDSRFGADHQTGRPGRMEIHLKRPGKGTPQKIIIDENGITFDIQGDMAFGSSGDMMFNSKGNLLLHGKLISMYGDIDIDNRKINSSETLVVRSGSALFG